jgi:hypothetical protein
MPLKLRFVRLLDEQRAARRTIADAVHILCQRANFQTDDDAKIHVGPLALPAGNIAGLIDVQFEDFGGEIIHCVSLPTSERFRAIRQGSIRRETFEIRRLVAATVNGVGLVTLADGTVVHALEVLPARLHYEPSDLDWRIMHHVVAIAGAQGRYYRHWPEGLEFARATKGWDQRRLRLDCSRLRDLYDGSLKKLYYAITKRDPELAFSKQKLAETLAMFGTREIKPRPRVA